MNIFKLVNLLPDVLKKGQVVANPELWKKGQITSGVLTTFLTAVLALAKVFGYDIPLTDEQIAYIASGILSTYGMYNIVATVASTDKVGLADKSSNT